MPEAPFVYMRQKPRTDGRGKKCRGQGTRNVEGQKILDERSMNGQRTWGMQSVIYTPLPPLMSSLPEPILVLVLSFSRLSCFLSSGIVLIGSHSPVSRLSSSYYYSHSAFVLSFSHPPTLCIGRIDWWILSDSPFFTTKPGRAAKAPPSRAKREAVERLLKLHNKKRQFTAQTKVRVRFDDVHNW